MAALPLLAAMLHVLESEDFQETDLSPVTDLSSKLRPSDPDAPGATVSQELAGRGLGQTGSVPIPQDLWDELAPEHLKWVGDNAPPLKGSDSRPLKALIQRLERDGLVQECPRG